MNCIVAVDKNWGIGYKNQLLASIPADKRFFREKTTGKVVIMGRKTLESLPGGRPLPGRDNIVISAQKDYQVPGALVVHSIEEARKAAEGYPKEDVFVIGGGKVYQQMLPYCDKAYVTKIDYAYQADVWFPDLQTEGFVLTEESEEQTCYDIEYKFCVFQRELPKGKPSSHNKF